MDYEKMWDTLKNNIKATAALPIEDSNNIIKATESVTRKTICFHILAQMEQIERASVNEENDKKYAL